MATTQNVLCLRQFEDFAKNEQAFPCEVCYNLDGRTCFGGSHTRRGLGVV
jgi:hypothetical protein